MSLDLTFPNPNPDDGIVAEYAADRVKPASDDSAQVGRVAGVPATQGRRPNVDHEKTPASTTNAPGATAPQEGAHT